MRVHPSSELRPGRRTSQVRTALPALLLAALIATPAAANIVAGTDVFVTQPGYSYQDFSPTPIPPGFFAPGSDPFTDIVYFNGDPLGGPFGPVDTIVERMAFAPLPACGDSFTVPIELVALSLVSVSPITVTYGPNPAQTWNVRVTLSSVTMPQPSGSMTIRKTHANGGTFSSTLPVQPKFTFTNVANPLDVRTLDTGGMIPPVILNSNGHWMDPPAAAGFFFMTIPAPTLLDNDLNPITPDKTIKQTSNFAAGMRGVGGSCENSMSGYGKTLTEEEQAWARHGVLPAQEHAPQPDGREGSTCLPDGSCIITTPTMASNLGGTYRGDDTYCAGDANNDGRDDNCPVLPGLAPWGSAALALLLMGSGLWFVSRRRASAGPLA